MKKGFDVFIKLIIKLYIFGYYSYIRVYNNNLKYAKNNDKNIASEK